MYHFFSDGTHKGTKLWDNGRKLAEFQKMVGVQCGYFCTEDAEIAESIRKYPLFNRNIRESKDGKVPNFEKPPQVNYIQKDSGVEVIKIEENLPKAEPPKEVKIDPSKFVRYGELKAKLFNEKGEIKKPSPHFKKEEIAQLLTEFEELKKQIEV